MPRKRFTEEQIEAALRELDAGAKVPAICYRYGVSERTLYLWRARRRAAPRPPEPGEDPPDR
ncbi:MAG TPA: transposase [Anaeromyxobacteraceae bacterium]